MSAHHPQRRTAADRRSSKSSNSSKRSGAAASSDSILKKKVGGYLIGDTIGEGSFAKVRSAIHILTQEKVAIKIIDKKLIAKREYVRKNLRREAAILQKLRHPNICQLYEVLETSNNYYLVLEFAEGGEFMKYLCEKRKLSERECRKYIRQLLSAIDHMHQAEIVHRDIKVENFLLDEDMNLKVIDLGLSNVMGPDGLLRTQCGSPAYAAPEIFCNSSYGPGVDVWSIGVNMYAMLTGELPFVVDPPNNMTKLHARILQGCKIPDNLTKDCQHLLGRIMKINEKERITVREIMKHPWINRGYSHHLKPQNNSVKTNDVFQCDENILRLMTNAGYAEDEVRESVVANKPMSENASYHLMVRRIRHGWGSPDSNISNTRDITCAESVTNQSPCPDSPESTISFIETVTNRRPKSGRTRLQQKPNRTANTQMSEMNRRIDQARNLKSPVVREQFDTGRKESSVLTTTISIVKTPSKESIFEDMKRTLESSLVNLDINNNNVPDASAISTDDVMQVAQDPSREVESRLSISQENSKHKVASIVCDRKGKTGALSSVVVQGTPAADRRQIRHNDSLSARSTPKRARLFHKRSDEERRRQSVASTTSSTTGCMVIVNGRLAGDDSDPGNHARVNSRADVPTRIGSALRNSCSQGKSSLPDNVPTNHVRVNSRADVPDRIGSALRNSCPQGRNSLPVTRAEKHYHLQRPHTEGSVDTGRYNNLPSRVVSSPYTGRGFPQHKLGLYYSTSGRHTKHSRAMTYAPVGSSTIATPDGRNGRHRGHRQRHHQRSFTAPSPARIQNGSLPAPSRNLSTAPSDLRGWKNHPRPRANTNAGLPNIFVSSFKNV